MHHVVIMAGGKGTRMKSDLPKVLHEVKGVSIITRLLDSVTQVCKIPTIIIGYKGQDVVSATGNLFHYVEQKEQLGTGHAVKVAVEELRDKNIKSLVIIPGDHPLISVLTLKKLIENHTKSDAVVTIGTVKIETEDPRFLIFNNYGRVIRDVRGNVERIVEYKDATEKERAIREFNISYYCFNALWLFENINKIKNNNVAGEFYLTDIVQIAKKQGKHVDSYILDIISEALGINTPEQLKMVEDELG